MGILGNPSTRQHIENHYPNNKNRTENDQEIAQKVPFQKIDTF
jgi:hypothetical protein